MGHYRPLFIYFRSLLVTISIEKSIDGVLGIRTRGRRMVGADETTELWRPPCFLLFVDLITFAASCLGPFLDDRDVNKSLCEIRVNEVQQRTLAIAC